MVCGESAKGANPEPNGAEYPLVVHGLPGRFSVARQSRFQLTVECPEKALSEIKRIWVKVGDRRISFTRHDNGFQATFALGAGFKLMSLLCQDHEGKVDALAHRLVLSRGKGKVPQGSGAPPVPFVDRAGKTSPFVSVIIVNHNGERHLEDLFDSLREQTYEHFEIVMVDNGSSDGSVERALASWPGIRVVAESSNAGFAEGSNLGQEAAKGNLLCLLNNDVAVAPNWLEELVLEWKGNKRTGAVCSKVMFWKPFIEFSVKCRPEGTALSLRESSLEEFHPRYGKVLYRDPPVRSADDAWIDLRQPLAVRLPYEGQECIRLTFQNPSSEEGEVELCWGNGEPSTHAVPSGTHIIELKVTESEIDPRWVINNAGSRLNRRTLKAGDRGIFQYDDGQYDRAEAVTAICGCSVLVDPSSIPGESLFVQDFFTYCEDTDLSLRIHRNGYKLRYAPRSVAYHKHASSSKQDSPFFRFHLSRNRLYMNMLHAKESVWRGKVDEAVKNFRQMKEDADAGGTNSEKEFAGMIPQLLEDLRSFEERVANGRVYERQRRLPRVGMYRKSWNILGDEERNALTYALHLAKFGLVDLIAESDFDLDALAKQGELDLKHCRKRVVPSWDSACAAAYDVFVNTTTDPCVIPSTETQLPSAETPVLL